MPKKSSSSYNSISAQTTVAAASSQEAAFLSAQSRPQELETLISNQFNECRNNKRTGYVAVGSKNYGMPIHGTGNMFDTPLRGISVLKLVENIHQRSENRQDFAVLDLGAGNGMFALELQKKNIKAKSVSAHDLRRDNLPPDDDYLLIDAHKLSEYFPEQAFDVVIASMLFCHLADPAGALIEAYSMLKPGGYLLLDGRFNFQGIESLDPLFSYLRDKGYQLFANYFPRDRSETNDALNCLVIKKTKPELTLPLSYQGVNNDTAIYALNDQLTSQYEKPPFDCKSTQFCSESTRALAALLDLDESQFTFSNRISYSKEDILLYELVCDYKSVEELNPDINLAVEWMELLFSHHPNINLLSEKQLSDAGNKLSNYLIEKSINIITTHDKEDEAFKSLMYQKCFRQLFFRETFIKKLTPALADKLLHLMKKDNFYFEILFSKLQEHNRQGLHGKFFHHISNTTPCEELKAFLAEHYKKEDGSYPEYLTKILEPDIRTETQISMIAHQAVNNPPWFGRRTAEVHDLYERLSKLGKDGMTASKLLDELKQNNESSIAASSRENPHQP